MWPPCFTAGGKARFSLRVLVLPRLSFHPRPHTTAPDEFPLVVFTFPSDCCQVLLTRPKSHKAWGPRLKSRQAWCPRRGGVSADRRLTMSCLSLSPQVLYNVFESFVTLGGDKVTGVDCVKGIGVWLAGRVPAGSQGQCLLRSMDPSGQHLCQAGTHSLCRETFFHFKILVTGPLPPRQVPLMWFSRPQPPWAARIIFPTDLREDGDPVSGVLGIPLGRNSYRQIAFLGAQSLVLAVNPPPMLLVSALPPRRGSQASLDAVLSPPCGGQSLCPPRESASCLPSC